MDDHPDLCKQGDSPRSGTLGKFQGLDDWACVHRAQTDARANLTELIDGACDAAPCKETRYEVSLIGLLPIARKYRQFREEILKRDAAQRAELTGSSGQYDPGIPLSIVNESSSVSIFFDDLKVIQYEDQPALTLVGLLGGVGGFFGLFLGFSLFSFLELAEYLFVMVFRVNRNALGAEERM